MPAFRYQTPILKHEDQADGSLLVRAIATSEAVDSQRDSMPLHGSKRAVAKWFETGPAVREQHDRYKAVGRGLAFEVNEKEKNIEVEFFVSKGAQDTQAKVKDGTLAMVSVGGNALKSRVEKRDGKPINVIEEWEMVELSLVDRGANPDAQILLFKADGGVTDVVAEDAPAPEAAKDDRIGQALHAAMAKGKKDQTPAPSSPAPISGEPKPNAPAPAGLEKKDYSNDERKKLAAEGKAMPDGSYPISDVADLKDAVSAFGRAKNKVAVKRYIKRRAKELDAVDQLPETWKVQSILLAKHFGGGEECDLRGALDILEGVKFLVMSEMAEGEDETEQLEILADVETGLRRFIELEADELLAESPDGGAPAIPDDPAGQPVAAAATPTIVKLAEYRMRKFTAQLTKAIEPVAAELVEIKKQNDALKERVEKTMTVEEGVSLSKAVGEGLAKVEGNAIRKGDEDVSRLKAVIGEELGKIVGPIAKTVDQIAAQPVLAGGPMKGVFRGVAAPGPDLSPDSRKTAQIEALQQALGNAPDAMTKAHLSRWISILRS